MRPELPINAHIIYLLILALISSRLHPTTLRVLMQPLR